MGTPKAMENKRLMFEIPVWRGTEQTQEQDTAGPIPAQEQYGTAEEAKTSPNAVHRKRQMVPIQEKALLTIEEAAEYTGIGLHKLRELSNEKSCTFVLWNGSKRMFKRKKLIEYLEGAYSI